MLTNYFFFIYLNAEFIVKFNTKKEYNLLLYLSV